MPVVITPPEPSEATLNPSIALAPAKVIAHSTEPELSTLMRKASDAVAVKVADPNATVAVRATSEKTESAMDVVRTGGGQGR